MTGCTTHSDAIAKAEARELIAQAFEEAALVLGGLIAVHRVDDEFVWRFIKSLDVVRLKAVRNLEDIAMLPGEKSPESEPKLNPHPAIEEFLLKLRRA